MVKRYKAKKLYGDLYERHKRDLKEILWYYSIKKGKKVAVWGAGLKGTAFLAVLDPKNKYVDYVIDANSNLHGTLLPTGHIIGKAGSIMSRKIDIIFVMNTKFYAEIFYELQNYQFTGTLIDIDIAIAQNMNAKQIITSPLFKVIKAGVE
jgi:hypothetical protein